jgi:hypothetical protein
MHHYLPTRLSGSAWESSCLLNSWNIFLFEERLILRCGPVPLTSFGYRARLRDIGIMPCPEPEPEHVACLVMRGRMVQGRRDVAQHSQKSQYRNYCLSHSVIHRHNTYWLRMSCPVPVGLLSNNSLRYRACTTTHYGCAMYPSDSYSLLSRVVHGGGLYLSP